MEGVSGVIGYVLAVMLYPACRTQISFIVSYVITLIGALFILLFQLGAIPSDFVHDLGAPPSGYPQGSEKDKQHNLGYVVPYFTFIAKVGTHLTFSIAYLASYSNQLTFPLLKRATAVGICNFCARFATMFAPLCAELDQPIPMIIILSVNTVGLVTSFFFPFYSQERWRTSK